MATRGRITLALHRQARLEACIGRNKNASSKTDFFLKGESRLACGERTAKHQVNSETHPETPIKGFYTVKGLDPSGSGECDFKIAAKQVGHLETHGPTHRYYELISAGEVLKNPLVIFEGLQRDGQEKALGYVGRPKRYGYDWSAPGHKNMVFLVCLTKEKTIF